MNGKKLEKVSFSWFMKFCRKSDDKIVAGSLFDNIM